MSEATIGWIGIGRMGYAMAERLAKSGADLTVWNRTRTKAEPLAAHGAKIAAQVSELADRDIVFVMVSTWDDVKEVVAGPAGLLSGAKTPNTGSGLNPTPASSPARAARNSARVYASVIRRPTPYGPPVQPVFTSHTVARCSASRSRSNSA